MSQDLFLKTNMYLLDEHLFNKAKKADEERLGLESPCFQFKVLNSLSSELTEKFVKHSLDKAAQTVKDTGNIILTWKQRDAGDGRIVA